MISPLGHCRIRSDRQGDGHLAAPRGRRIHAGEDIEGLPMQPVVAPCNVFVRREVQVYADDERWRGLELVGSDTIHKLYYVEPLRELIGTHVLQGEIIGHLQDVSVKYNQDVAERDRMGCHLHWQVLVAPTKLVGL